MEKSLNWVQWGIINLKQRWGEPGKGAPPYSPHFFPGTLRPSVKAQLHPTVGAGRTKGRANSTSTHTSIFLSSSALAMGAAILYFWPFTTSGKIPGNSATAVFYENLTLRLLRSGHRIHQKRESLSALFITTKEAAICTANPSISDTGLLMWQRRCEPT